MIEPLQREYRLVYTESDIDYIRKFRKALLGELKSRVKNSAYEQDIGSAVKVKLKRIKLRPLDQCMVDLKRLKETETIIFLNPLKSGLIAALCQNFADEFENLLIYVGTDTGLDTELNRKKINVLNNADPQFLANTIVQITKDSKRLQLNTEV